MTAAEGLRFPWDTAPEPGQAIAVADGVLWLRMPMRPPLGHVNVYALEDGAGWTVIDTGVDTADTRAAWTAALAGPLSGRSVTRVIATHHHPDHIGLAGWFQTAGAALWTSRTAYLMARMLVLDEQPVWPEETVAFYRAAGMAEDVLTARLAERPFNFAEAVHPLALGYRRLVEGEVVQIGARHWQVRMGAGHAPEHVTLWDTEGELVLGGDQVLPGISPNLGVYPTEPEADPVADWLAACARLAEGAGEGQLVLPGHKLPFYGLPMRLRQLSENHHAALGRLRDHLAEPKSAGQCFMPLFRREVRGGEYGLALVEAYAHCLHLWHAGAARRWRENGVDLFQTAG